jgi:hypothetical protein
MMPSRILCNGVKREGVKDSTDLASGLFCNSPLHNFRYSIRDAGKEEVEEIHWDKVGIAGFKLAEEGQRGYDGEEYEWVISSREQTPYPVWVCSA